MLSGPWIRPVVTIGPEVCEKCGGAVTMGCSYGYFYREKRETEVTWRRFGKGWIDVTETAWRWGRDKAHVHYTFCSACHWTVIRPLDGKVIGSAFYATVETA